MALRLLRSCRGVCILKLCYIAALAFTFAQAGVAADSNPSTNYSVLWQSYAANAGGQNAYALKYGRGEREYGLFLNEYLLSSGKPIFGATYDLRYALCGMKCPVQFYGHAGVGLSSSGPLIQLGWSSYWLWLVRVDVMSQIYFDKTRLVHWSYPLWFGVSVPLP